MGSVSALSKPFYMPLFYLYIVAFGFFSFIMLKLPEYVEGPGVGVCNLGEQSLCCLPIENPGPLVRTESWIGVYFSGDGVVTLRL